MSSSQSVYAAPEASVLSQVSPVGVAIKPSFFGFSGRLNRIRFFLFGMAYLFLFAAVMVPVIALFSTSTQDPSGPAIAIFIVLYIAFVIGYFSLCIRRCHDLGHSGWMSLLLIIPVLGTFFYFYLMLAKGQRNENDWGQPPTPSPTWQKVITWVFALLTIAYLSFGIVILLSN
ncbi:DUF805 domain-containing protein [Algicola sagamiensis]|uniref:DUF805 domain-containing protein n=1 Tax=Algicola sagamiensis TaxID=163869 RepID=UPI0003712D86|nr:DUF805 domain-containing protein [Algicola sagamiensis]